MPITWKNIGANFSDSNQLLMNGGKTLSDAFSNLGSTLQKQGEYNKERNTQQAIAEMGAISDLETMAAKRQEIAKRWFGKNADMAQIDQAGKKQTSYLQGNETFADNRKLAELNIAGKQFGVDTQQETFDMDKAAHKAELASRRLADLRTKQEYNANTPEAIAKASDADFIKTEIENNQQIREINAKESAKRHYTGRNKPNLDLIGTVSNNFTETTRTTQNKVSDLYTTYPDVRQTDIDRVVQQSKLDGYAPGSGILNGFDFEQAKKTLKTLDDQAKGTKLKRVNDGKKRIKYLQELQSGKLTRGEYMTKIAELK